MKMCPSCKVHIGDEYDHCLLCQNSLEDLEEKGQEYPFFPEYNSIKLLSMFFKIQLFIAVTIIISCIAIDYMFGIRGNKHWSWIIVAAVVAVELLIIPIIRKRRFTSTFVTQLTIMLSLVLWFSTWYMGGYAQFVRYELPIIIMIACVYNFIASLVDKSGNALVYSLGNVLVGVVPETINLIVNRHAPVLWNVCLLVNVICIVGLIIFKGQMVRNEVVKRLNI